VPVDFLNIAHDISLMNSERKTSDLTALEASCPKCEAETSFAPVTVLTDLQTGDLKSLFSGSLNTVHCEACETDFLYETPILYRDDAGRWMVYYLPPTIIERLDDAVLQVEKVYDTVFKDFSSEERPGCRLVTKRNALIEKIAIHQRQFDDRIIEYIKYQLYQNCDNLDTIRHELLFDFGNTTESQLMFLAFDRDTGKPTFSMAFPVEDYESLSTYFLSSEKMEHELGRMFRPHFIQVDDLI
tara:strand:- start:3883 stop:4608 length:726 start_codon:yes stop_codon:yes gene_type:complete